MKVLVKRFNKQIVWFIIVLFVLGVVIGFPTSWYKQKSYYSSIPLKFERSDLPYVEALVQGACCPLVLDLGSKGEMDLNKDVLKQFYKTPYGFEKWINFEGKVFEYPTYSLPKIEVGSIVYEKPVVVELPASHRNEYSVYNDETKERAPYQAQGYLGRGLLRKSNILIDAQHSKIIFSSNLKKLKKDGYDTKSFIKVPFQMTSKGIVIKVDTDIGRMKLLLDTGSTWTFLHKKYYPKEREPKINQYGFSELVSTQFVINKEDFGNQELFFLKMTDKLSDIDGLLGMDFIKKHAIYIDFSKNTLYILHRFQK